jgi:LCP family protein required for cell wall assembly
MSEDWWKGWYQGETQAGGASSDQTPRDMPAFTPAPGAAGGGGGAGGAAGAGGGGGGWAGMGAADAGGGRAGAGTAPGAGETPVAGGPAGQAGSNWPQQPPQRSGYSQEPEWGRGASGLRRDGDYGRPNFFRRGLRRLYPPGKRGRRIALTAGLLVVVLIAALAGSYFWVNSKLNRSVALPAFSGQSAGTNWLIVGSDTRDGLTTAQIIQDHVGFDFGTANSDSLMLLHMGGPKPVLISIPRDSYVPIPGYGDNKINAALGFGGPTLLVKTVEEVTGLRIDHYMGIGFGGLVSVVNTVGGVRICLTTALHDADSGANLSAGCHNLNGTQALAFVRDRHSFADEDLQRMQDQRAFLKALLSKATSPSVYLNPFTALPFASSAASSISVDKGTDLYDLTQAALALRNPETGTVPIANANYETSNAGDAVQWNQTEALALFKALQNNKPIPSGLLSGTKVG